MYKLYNNSKVLFFGEFKGRELYIGSNNVYSLYHVLMHRGFSKSEIADKLYALAERGYLKHDEVGESEGIISDWILEKAVPKNLRSDLEGNWGVIQELLGMKK